MPKAAPIADSWDDDEPESELPSVGTLAADADISRDQGERPRTADYPRPPPPTPASPRSPVSGRATSRDAAEPLDALLHPSQRQHASPSSNKSDERPEKSMSVANRIIAAGLGIKAPAQTEEQKRYDKAVMERERQARAEKKGAKQREQEERAETSRAMWED